MLGHVFADGRELNDEEHTAAVLLSWRHPIGGRPSLSAAAGPDPYLPPASPRSCSIVIGIVLNLLADQAFKKHDTTVKPFEESSTLITDGVFMITRSPMYLGMVPILLGVTMLLGSAAPFAVVLLLAALLDRVFITSEEQKLEDTFGERFRQYRRRARRWI